MYIFIGTWPTRDSTRELQAQTSHYSKCDVLFTLAAHAILLYAKVLSVDMLHNMSFGSVYEWLPHLLRNYNICGIASSSIKQHGEIGI